MVQRAHVRTPGAKTGVVLISVLLVVLVGVALVMVDFALGYLVATGLVVALVLVTSRVFRGMDESDEPRDWWKMTAAPASSGVVGALFLLQAISNAVSLIIGQGASIVWVGVAVGIVVAAGYFHSAIRQSRRHHPVRP